MTATKTAETDTTGSEAGSVEPATAETGHDDDTRLAEPEDSRKLIDPPAFTSGVEAYETCYPAGSEAEDQQMVLRWAAEAASATDEELADAARLAAEAAAAAADAMDKLAKAADPVTA